jgi:uncharacterized protein
MRACGRDGGKVTDAGLTAIVPNDAPLVALPPRSWLEAIAVLVAGLAILAVATLAGSGVAEVFDRWADIGAPRAYRAGTLESLSTMRLGAFLAAFQLAAVVLTLWTARMFRGDHVAFMALSPLTGGVRSAVKWVALMMVCASGYASAVFAVDQGALLSDVKPFAEIMHSRTWWIVFLVAAVGAPIAEEALFRGLMFGVLKASPVGGVGAALVTAFVWASVHAQYSFYGLGAIFLIGLYLAWVREKTGSLIAPMLCHGVYNASIIVALMLAPESVFEVG